MIVCGLDLGLSGGVAFLTKEGDPINVTAMPTRKSTHGKEDIDVCALRSIFKEVIFACKTTVCLVVQEYIRSYGQNEKMNPQSLISFGRGVGKVQAFLELDGYPYMEVDPKDWQKVILRGTSQDKEVAIGYALSRWPMLCSKLSYLGRGGKVKYHDGMCDALCMAEFARRQLFGEQTP